MHAQFDRMLKWEGGRILDERGLIAHALALEFATRGDRGRPGLDPGRLAQELVFGAELPAVKMGGNGGVTPALMEAFRSYLGLLPIGKRGGGRALAAAERFLEVWAHDAVRISMVALEIKTTGVAVWRFSPEDLQAALAYCAARLLDRRPNAPGVLLSRCQWHECGTYFLAPLPGGMGRPRRRYCSDAHMMEAHNDPHRGTRRAKSRRKPLPSENARRRTA